MTRVDSQPWDRFSGKKRLGYVSVAAGCYWFSMEYFLHVPTDEQYRRLHPESDTASESESESDSESDSELTYEKRVRHAERDFREAFCNGLTGAAAAWLKKSRDPYRIPLEELKREFFDRFEDLPMDEFDIAFQEIEKHEPGTSVRPYLDRVSAFLAYYSVMGGKDVDHLVPYFRNGLSGPYQMELFRMMEFRAIGKQKEKLTLASVQQKVLCIDRCYQSLSREQAWRLGKRPIAETGLQGYCKRHRGAKNKSSAASAVQVSTRNETRKCFNCNETGQIRANCPY